MPEPKRQARVTTKTGDTGDTSLFGPGRIRKTDPRIEALGDLDETQAAIGLARAIATGSVAETLLELQRALYVAMSEVGTPESDRGRLPKRIDATAVAEHGDLHRHLSGLLGHRLDLIDQHRAVRAERGGEDHLDLGFLVGEHDLADEVEVDHRKSDLGVEHGLKGVEDLLLLLGIGDDG